MTHQTRKSAIIPSTEIRLRATPEGEIVLISIPKDTARGLESHWTIFMGNRNGVDTYMAPSAEPSEGDSRLVVLYSAPRRTTEFDKNLGAILEEHYDINFIGPLHNKDIYDRHVQKLKQADLWMD